MMKENRKLMREILKDVRRDMTDEEVLNLLADSKISENCRGNILPGSASGRYHCPVCRKLGLYLLLYRGAGIVMVINVVLAARAFDPYPFILLNLVLSCVAAIQAPLIMMSQNRQEEKDRRRAENDYKVNLKTEIMIEDLYDKVNLLLARQAELEKGCKEPKKKPT